MVNAPALLEARGICKSFPGVRALDDVAVRLERGEVLCIVGENGAGKSTLMKILGGVYTADAGQIRLDGRPVEIGGVERAQQLGVTLIHQELNLAPTLDVAGNLFLGREPCWAGPLKLINRRIDRDAQEILARLGLDCSPRTLVSRLSIGQQQLVEIGRSLSLASRMLIMDEPTSSLTQRETERLFAVIRDLKRDGVSILYISHRLAEVQEIADRVTVLRDGKNAGELSRAEISHEAIVRLMVGRELKQFFHRPAAARTAADRTAAPAEAPPALELRGVRVTGAERRAIDLAIGGGEIVGMSGLMGAGRTELAEAIFGVRPLAAGQVLVDGRPVRLRSPRDAIAAGVFLAPEDRRHQGLILEQSVCRNISLPSLERLSVGKLIARGASESWPRRCGSGSTSAPPTSTSWPACSAAATSRRSCSPAGWRARPAC